MPTQFSQAKTRFFSASVKLGLYKKDSKSLTIRWYYDIISTNTKPNPIGFVIDVFIDIGVKQSR